MDGLKQQRRWQENFILLQQQLFQDEYSAVVYYEPQPRGHCSLVGAVATREANESLKRALEKQASQQKAKKRKVHTHFSRDWPRMGMPPPQSQR